MYWLLHRQAGQRMEEILGKMEYIQFGAVDDFLHLMIAAEALPHTDLSQYPTVEKKLRESYSSARSVHSTAQTV